MNWFDIAILLVFFIAFIRGGQRGLTMQLAGLVAIIIGAIFAGKAADILLPYLLKTINISTYLAIVLSYVFAFLIIVFAIKLLGKMLHTLIEALHIGFLNKIIGAIVGVISASFVLSILLNLAVVLDPKEKVVTSNIKSNSYFFTKIEKVVPVIVPYLKKEVWEKYIPKQLKEDNNQFEESEHDEPSMLSKSKQLKI